MSSKVLAEMTYPVQNLKDYTLKFGNGYVILPRTV